MSVVIWDGAVASPYPGGSAVSFTLDPATGAIAQASTSGPIQFIPSPGYAELSGAFSSQVTFAPGSLPADPPAAWAAAVAQLVLLDPAKTYTMVITEM